MNANNIFVEVTSFKRCEGLNTIIFSGNFCCRLQVILVVQQLKEK